MLQQNRKKVIWKQKRMKGRQQEERLCGNESNRKQDGAGIEERNGGARTSVK